jgi:hypothetical protein
MEKIILILVLSVMIISCSDIMTTEPKYDKELIFKNMTSSDSLSVLDIPEVDLGIVRGIYSEYIKIRNNSDKHSITIFNIENTNKSGLFTYNYPKGIPFSLSPLEDTEMTKKIEVKFIADSFVPDFYYDTLIINFNKDFYIPVKVKTRY